MLVPLAQARLPLTRRPARAALLAAALAAAPAAAPAYQGTSGADFLSTRPSARAAAMGGAFVALGDDLSALYYNPAAMAHLQGPSMNFLEFSQVAQVSMEELAYAQPFPVGTLALGVVYQGEPAINNPQATDNPVVAWNLAVTAAYADSLRVLADSLGLDLPDFVRGAEVGVGVKYIQSQLGGATAYDGAVDLGARVPLDEGIELGVSLLNLGPPITFIQYGDPLPATALVGLSRSFAPIWYNQFNVDADLDYPLQDLTRLHFGLEDWIDRSIALRVGYVLDSQDSLNGMTFGVGAQLVQQGLTFHLDYAVVPFYFQGFGSFEVQQQFQLGLTF